MHTAPTRTFSTMIGRQVLSPLGEPFAAMMDIVVDVRDDRVTFAILKITSAMEDFSKDELVSVPWHSVRVDSQTSDFVVDPTDFALGQLAADDTSEELNGMPAGRNTGPLRKTPVVARLLP